MGFDRQIVMQKLENAILHPVHHRSKRLRLEWETLERVLGKLHENRNDADATVQLHGLVVLDRDGIKLQARGGRKTLRVLQL